MLQVAQGVDDRGAGGRQLGGRPVGDQVERPVEAQQRTRRRAGGQSHVEARGPHGRGERSPGRRRRREDGGARLRGAGGHDRRGRDDHALGPTVVHGDPHVTAVRHHRPGRGRRRLDAVATAGTRQPVHQRHPAPVQVVHVAHHRQVHLHGDQVGRHAVEVGDVGRGTGEHLDHLAGATVQAQLVEPGRSRPVGQAPGRSRGAAPPPGPGVPGRGATPAGCGPPTTGPAATGPPHRRGRGRAAAAAACPSPARPAGRAPPGPRPAGTACGRRG